jgi:transcriptional regulator of heat shock response
MGKVIDHLDEALKALMPQAASDVTVRLGANNPFGDDCAVVYRAVPLGSQQVFVGLLGPVRMDYDLNVGRLAYVGRLLS